ncbi:MAG TPA: abortive infection system antitoxin AbiGi family protein [Verrucomicrobiae bacterium]|nr:abortive infection system antitoxin AbiGi family protein [Verrucomicrobiae bacterium]
MRTGKERKPAGNIHRQQLFYWMGASLDRRNKRRKVLRDDLVRACLEQVAASLKRGIWVKTPRVPEQFQLRDEQFRLDLPIACFTEWSLGESLPHTSEYGRIGLGFPKRWVIERGGQSVTYFRHNERGHFLRSAFRLLNALGEPGPDGAWRARGISGLEDLRYLLHFAKMIRLRPPEREGRKVKSVPEVRPRTRRKKKPGADKQAYRRKFGAPLHFVEEREWRIVYSEANRRFVKGPGIPDFFLPYLPGEELFTLVLPDNKVVSRLLERDWFTDRLFTPWKHYPELKGRRVPPVTVLAHSDIGTY